MGNFLYTETYDTRPVVMSETTRNKINYIIKENPELLDEIINILLVAFKGRQATLIETANFESNIGIKKGMKVLNDLLNILNKDGYSLAVTNDPVSLENYPRYYIYVSLNGGELFPPDTHEGIGKLLEFYCYKHPFYDQNQDRLGISINVVKDEYKSQIYGEFCIESLVDLNKLKENLQNKVNKWTKVMRDNGFLYNFEYKIEKWHSIPNLKAKLKENNLNFVLNNIQSYKQLIEDHYNPSIYNKLILKLEKMSNEKKIKFLSTILSKVYV